VFSSLPARVHGYRLFAPVPRTAVVAVKRDDKDTSTAGGAVRADTIEGDVDKVGAVEMAGAQLTEPAPYRGDPGHKHDSGGGANGVSELGADASAPNGGDVSSGCEIPAFAVIRGWSGSARDAAAAPDEPTAAAPASPSTEETTSQQLGPRGNDRDQHQLLECLRCNFIAHMLSDVHAEHDWQHRSRRD
jgi:hypothetical protein